MRALLVVTLLAALLGGAALVTAGDRATERLRQAAPRVRDAVPGLGDRRPPALRPVTCPADVAGCHRITGRVVFVERVDPDGDGDLHVVVAGRGGATLPGLTAVDVPPALRPSRDPAIGDLVSAAGPVQTGSYGQRQVHALRFRAARAETAPGAGQGAAGGP